jgi:hypothetical protein
MCFARPRAATNSPNRTTLCAWHHLREVHAGVVRCTGVVPDALRFELGLRGLVPPLISMTYAPGERLVRRRPELG